MNRSSMRPPREVLRWLYVDRRLSDAAIGQLCGGASPTTVAHWRRQLGVHRRPQAAAVPPAVLRELYVARRLTIKQVAAHTGQSAMTIHRLLQAAGIPTRQRGRPPGAPRPLDDRLPTDQALAELYVAGWAIKPLARKFGVGPATIHHRLQTAGVRFRPRGRQPQADPAVLANDHAPATGPAAEPTQGTTTADGGDAT